MLGRSLAFLTLVPLALLHAQDPRIDQAVTRLIPEITEIRHRIHQNPELGNREVETARLVAQYLRRLGFAVDTGIAHTGVVAVLRGGRPGPVVAVRADMDALPVTEATDLPFRSTKRGTYLGQEVGISHACGHDIHVAVQLGVASVLASVEGVGAEPGTVEVLDLAARAVVATVDVGQMAGGIDFWKTEPATAPPPPSPPRH